MTYEQATTQITLLLQPDSEPSLTTAEVSAIVDLSARMDSNGVAPTATSSEATLNTNWKPTYDVYAGVAFGWRVKAAKVAGNYQFKDDTLQLNREQVIDHCLKMAAEYSKMTSSTITVESYREQAMRRAGLLDTMIAEVYDYDLDAYLY